MTKIIQFPHKNFNKNNKKTIDVNRDKNKLTLAASILSLVLGLSVFNNKMDSGFSNPNRGMRGLASVEDTNFELNTDEIIKLINSKNSRKIASLARKPTNTEQFLFGRKFSMGFVVGYDSDNFITTMDRQKGNTENENEIQFREDEFKNNVNIFGASSMARNGDVIDVVSNDGTTQRKNNFTLFDDDGQPIANLNVVTDIDGDIISVKVQ